MIFKNVSFSYNSETEVLKNISFEIDNKTIGIIGKSGCGKTTLLNLISGLLIPDEGKVNKNGKDIAYLSQKPVLLQYRNSFENALLGVELRNKYNDQIAEKLDKLFSLFHLNDAQKLFPNELSGGMKQRVGIVQTLLIESDIYLLDEPFNATDRNTLSRIEKYIWNTFKEKQCPAIIVTHDIEQALLISDRIIMLSSNPGTIVFDRTYPKDFCKTEPALRKKHPEFNNYLIEIVKEFSEL